jgi:FkbM family methyltransferase
MGYFTIYAAKMGCRVMAFEPLPRLVNFIRVNLELNHLTGMHKVVFAKPLEQVTIVEAAVSNEQGKFRWVRELIA